MCDEKIAELKDTYYYYESKLRGLKYSKKACDIAQREILSSILEEIKTIFKF